MGSLPRGSWPWAIYTARTYGRGKLPVGTQQAEKLLAL